MVTTKSITPEQVFSAVGASAIIIGASISAFFAKTPSTLAMWASAYLVLVVGVAQIIFGKSISQLAPKGTSDWRWWVFGLFNAGSATVIASSVCKYSGYEQHVSITAAGAILIIAALSLLGWQIRHAKPSAVKSYTYALIALLGVTSLIGIVLAGHH